MRATRYLSRQELYRMVWSAPMTAVAKQIGLSDVGLAKACRRAVVPVPERGYWAKLKSGKQGLPPSLPPRGLGMTDGTDVIVERSEGNDEGSIGEPPLVPPVFEEDIAAVTSRVRQMVGKVVIIKAFTKPHPLIARLLEEDEARRQAASSSPFMSTWNKPQFDSPAQRRRLRFLNTLFLALARCDIKTSKAIRDEGEYQVHVGSQYVPFVLRPIVSRNHRAHAENQKEKIAQERLQFNIQPWTRDSSPWMSWEDKDGVTLEDQLTDIVVHLIVAGEAKYRDLLQHHYEWELKWKAQKDEEACRKRAEEEQRERERQLKEEKERIERLLNEAAAVRQAADIRAYVDIVLAAVGSTSNQVSAERLQQWVEWARAEADRIDPIRSGKFLAQIDSGPSTVRT